MEKELQETKSSKFKNIMNHSGMEARRYDQLDQYYGMYRLGLAMASQGKSDGLGVTRDNPTVWVRNSVEADILNKAEKEMGVKPTRLIPPGNSEEITSVNKASPVAKPKRNQYGV
jgi:hypothetical protein